MRMSLLISNKWKFNLNCYMMFPLSLFEDPTISRILAHYVPDRYLHEREQQTASMLVREARGFPSDDRDLGWGLRKDQSSWENLTRVAWVIGNGLVATSGGRQSASRSRNATPAVWNLRESFSRLCTSIHGPSYDRFANARETGPSLRKQINSGYENDFSSWPGAGFFVG